MAVQELPTKKYQLDQEDFSTVIKDIIDPFTERIKAQNSRLATGYLDAPYLPEAISLGSENMSSPPIYKVNVPGYFYRQHYRNNWSSDGTAGVLLASSPSNLSSDSTRMVYMAGSDGTIGHANNMYPILPGSSTYVYIVRSSGISDSEVRNEWLFVPTVLAASINILPEEFVSNVGTPGTAYTLTGKANPLTASIITAFSGKWVLNFKSVCGWNVASETAANDASSGEVTRNGIAFLNDSAKAEFIANRKTWITNLGATPSDYGY